MKGHLSKIKKCQISLKNKYISKNSWKKDMAHHLITRKVIMNCTKYKIRSSKLKSLVTKDKLVLKKKYIYHWIWTRYLIKEHMPRVIDNDHIKLIFKNEERKSRWMLMRQIKNKLDKFMLKMKKRRFKIKSNTNQK